MQYRDPYAMRMFIENITSQRVVVVRVTTLMTCIFDMEDPPHDGRCHESNRCGVVEQMIPMVHP